jgi:hypothetical protein
MDEDMNEVEGYEEQEEEDLSKDILVRKRDDVDSTNHAPG